MFKKCFSVAMTVLMTNLCVFASTPLNSGKTLSVRITSEITSNSKTTPSAIVDNDVKGKGGRVLIKRGTPVMLQVERVSKRGCGRAGEVKIKCISTTAVDGQTILLSGGELQKEGKNKKGLAIGLGVGLGYTFLPGVGLAFLAIKGDDAKIESNELIPVVFIASDYEIDE